MNPDWTVCKSFLRGYCADGNEVLFVLAFNILKFRAVAIVKHLNACTWIRHNTVVADFIKNLPPSSSFGSF